MFLCLFELLEDIFFISMMQRLTRVYLSLIPRVVSDPTGALHHEVKRRGREFNSRSFDLIILTMVSIKT